MNETICEGKLIEEEILKKNYKSSWPKVILYFNEIVSIIDCIIKAFI